MDTIPRGSAVVIYRRMSTPMQQNSLQDQQHIIDQIVNEFGLHVMKNYADEGISGAEIASRNSLKALMAEVRTLGAKYVLVYDVSRLSRGGQADFWDIIKRLRQAGAMVYCCQHRLFVTENTGPIFGIEASFARSHNVKHSLDIARTLMETVATRKSDPGRVPPFGYDRMRVDERGVHQERVRYLPNGSKVLMDPITGAIRATLDKSVDCPKIKNHRVILVPGTPEQVAALKRIFRLSKTMGYAAVADVLNREGIPGPRGNGWCGSTVRSILLNTAYTGIVEFGKKYKGKYHRVRRDRPQEFEYLDEGKLNQGKNPKDEWFVEPDRHEALISEKEWTEVQAALRIRSRGSTKTSRSKRRTYLLSGIIRCGNCGSPLHGDTQRNRLRAEYYRYTCAGAKKRGTCHCFRNSIPGAAAEEFVLKEVRHYLVLPCVKESLREGLEKLIGERAERTEHRDDLRKQLAKLEAKKSALFDQLAPESLMAFKPNIDKLVEEEKRLRRSVAESESEAATHEDREELIKRALTFYEDNVLALQGGCKNAVRESLKALGTKVVYYPKRKEGTIEVHPFGLSAS